MSINQNILTEIPPITELDSFVVFDRKKTHFDFPIHIHKQFELNYIEGASGAQRIVGDHVSEIGDFELVLISGSNIEHAWYDHNCKSKEIHEITIQFNPDLFDNGFIDKKQFVYIKQMLERARQGLCFSQPIILSVRHILLEIVNSTDNFRSILLFLDLLNELSKDTGSQELSSSQFAKVEHLYDSESVQKVMTFLTKNYNKSIHLADAAKLVNMSEASFSRFIKLRTGKSFIDLLNDVRISAAARMLVDDVEITVAEIAYSSGFNNLSNFNRIFKKKRGVTPHDFRDQYIKKKIVV